MSDIKKTKLNPEEVDQTEKHLQFINHLTLHSVKYGYRTIVSGGYAVDGALGEITRPHDDLDIQIYGQDVMTPKLFEEKLLQGIYKDYKIEDRGREMHYHIFFIPKLSAEINYIRLATKPFIDSKIVIKSDNKLTAEHEFDTKIIVLNGVRYEVQSPTVEMADKKYKREHRGDKILRKHDQDIYNLNLITDSYDVDSEIQRMIKRAQSS